MKYYDINGLELQIGDVFHHLVGAPFNIRHCFKIIGFMPESKYPIRFYDPAFPQKNYENGLTIKASIKKLPPLFKLCL